jgi:hypothetical protein
MRFTRFLLFALLALPIASVNSAPRNLTEQEKASHVLNRLAFGARPGEVRNRGSKDGEARTQQQTCKCHK